MKPTPAALKTAPLALLVLVTGCATPKAQWASQRSALTQAQNAFAAMYDAGLIDEPPEDILKITSGFKAAKAALDTAGRYLDANGYVVDDYVDAFSLLLATAHAGLAEWESLKNQRLKE